MKKLMLICAVVFAFAINASAQTDTKPEFKFVSEKFDFGKIPLGKPVTTNFEYTNIGTEPLILTEVKPSCGCTIADYTKTPVLKGQKGTIKITFNAPVAGVFSKSIVVTSNAKTPQQIITISGEVLAPPASAVTPVGTK